jgi:hypothetical protein
MPKTSIPVTQTCTILGRVSKDVRFNSDLKVTNVDVCVTSGYYTGEGSDKKWVDISAFYSIAVWGEYQSIKASKLGKGDMVLFSYEPARLKVKLWRDTENKVQSNLEAPGRVDVVVDMSASVSSTSAPAGDDLSDAEIPL